MSWVQFQTGAVLDLAALGQACRRHGAWLVVDAIQGLGVLPFDLHKLGVDAVCGGTQVAVRTALVRAFWRLRPVALPSFRRFARRDDVWNPDDPVDLPSPCTRTPAGSSPDRRSFCRLPRRWPPSKEACRMGLKICTKPRSRCLID